MNTSTKFNAQESITALQQELAAHKLLIEDLSIKLATLTAPKEASSTKDMTDADARRVLDGDLKDTKHKDAASTLGLTYGQIYSCRLAFTFKHVHKAMKDAGIANPWVK